MGLPGSSDGKEAACNAGDMCLITGSRRSPWEGNGYLLQYSCLETPMDRGAWRATFHGFAESGSAERLTHTHTYENIYGEIRFRTLFLPTSWKSAMKYNNLYFSLAKLKDVLIEHVCV